MANTLGIEEVTLADIVKKTAVCNTITGRVTVLASKVIRLVGHVDDNVAEVGADTEKMALFESKAFGHPWVKEASNLNHIIFKSPADGLTPAPSNATYIVPNIDYSTIG